MKCNKILVSALTVSLVCASFSGCDKAKDKSSYEIKNVIIIIGDGMGLEHIKGGELYEDEKYSFNSWTQVAVDTRSYYGPEQYRITDSAAGGTAIATGVLTSNGYVGKDPEGNDLQTVMDIAKQKDKATGIITTDNIFGATPASFSGHSIARTNYTEIVETQITSSHVDLLCGAQDALTTSQATQQMLAQYGYTYCDDYTRIDESLNDEQAYWQFDLYGIDASVKLANVAQNALAFLERDKDGFVLMIEQAHIDKYSHSNELEGTLKSVAELNDTVEVVMEWIGNRTDTAVLVTADHETGGLMITTEGMSVMQSVESLILKQTVYGYYSSADHTAKTVGLFLYGIEPEFKNFSFYSSEGLIKNIETGSIIKNLLLNGEIN